MLIRVLSHQVPKVWEVIKYALVNTSSYEGEVLDKYLNSMLRQLLAGYTICVTELDADGNAALIAIIREGVDEWSGDKIAYFDCLYSFSPASNDIWKMRFDEFKKYLINRKISKIVAYSSNSRIFEVCGYLGFVERNRVFEYDGGLGYGAK